jgi:CheY-like chemotaxis protein
MADYGSDDATPLPATPTILVVEDEVLVRMAIAEYLRNCGFKVVEASNAFEAVDLIVSGLGLDLVFSDVRLANAAEGIVLAKWIKEHYPALRVILTSGHADAAKKAAALCPDQQLIAKPYDPGVVAERIQTLLAARSAAAK